jgi:hypothetical protein
MNSLEVRIAPEGEEWRVDLVVDRHGDRHILTKNFPSAEEAAKDAAYAVTTFPWAS